MKRKPSFATCVEQIRATARGAERNMYPWIRDLFSLALGHAKENIVIDSPQEGVRHAPDLILRADTGVVGEKGRALFADWIVVEAKDETGVFAAPEKREKIFNEKAKYIRVGTEWFVMIDPRQIVARPVAMRSQLVFDSATDIVMEWEDADEASFCEKFAPLAAAEEGERSTLRAFRDGDESQIAVVRLEADETILTSPQRERLAFARADFLESVRETTKLLQSACRQALTGLRAQIVDFKTRFDDFEKRWGIKTLEFSPAIIDGKNIESAEDADDHDRAAETLTQDFRRAESVAKLAVRGLPGFHDRMGDDANENLFADESANLILARVMLMRFMEDHGFFGDKKYVCNGGVKALQEMMRFYEKTNTVVLRLAYEKGATEYPTAFDETDLDWIFGSEDRQLSRAIELAMMLLSRFDFSTVRGDVLSGIYDKFMDRDKRKAAGEYYTPPSVARYILDRLDAPRAASVFDPSCGSGTFLLEHYERAVGEDVKAGRAGWEEARNVVAKIGGNDMNPFSAAVAKIQMLWHLLPLQKQTGAKHWPPPRVAERFNSLRRDSIMERGTPMAELNRPTHDIVVGNPPYIRPERAAGQTLISADAKFFEPIGGADKNMYLLFLYKALAGWCRPPESGGGRVGFVVPLSFCDSHSADKVRALFAPSGGQFRIIEIVDMESIAPFVFDAAVNPIVFIAENRPPTKNDKITIRVAGGKCVVDAGNRKFDLTRASEAKFRYADAFTADGRILTKITARRLRLIRKIRGDNATFADIAKPFWVGVKNNKIQKWTDTPPSAQNGGDLHWERREMIRRAAVFGAGGKVKADKKTRGVDFYKGENVRAARIEGDPAATNIDPVKIRDLSLWRFADILPERGFAFLQICLAPTVASFDPRECMMLDTVTLFFPRAELADFPFDLALLSRVYQYYCALALREGAVSKLFSHLYPTNLRLLPWPQALAQKKDGIESLRDDFCDVCFKLGNRGATLAAELQTIGAVEFAAVAKNIDARLEWSEELSTGGEAEIDAPTVDALSPAFELMCVTVRLGERAVSIFAAENADTTAVEDLARRLAAALTVAHGQKTKISDLRKLPIPKDARALEKFAAAARRYDAGGYDKALEAIFARIDKIVGAAFGLSESEIQFIQKEMREDDFLKNIRPRLPFAGSKQRGLLAGLDDSDRYRPANGR